MINNLYSDKFYPEIYQAVAGKNYVVYAYMNDGRIRMFDVKPLIEKGGVFSKIADEDVFKNTLTVINGTVAWDLNKDRDETTCLDVDPITVFNCPVVNDITD